MTLAVTPGTGATMLTDDIAGVKSAVAKLQVGAAGTDNGLVAYANPLPVITSPLITAGSAFTRVADTNAYAANDFIGNSTTAASCTISNSGFTLAMARLNDMPGRITGGTLDKSTTSTTNAIFRAHLFGTNPLASAPNAGDNGALQPAAVAAYLGYIDFTFMSSLPFTAGQRCRGIIGTGGFINFKPDNGTKNIYAILQAMAAYTPGNAETFTLTLEAE